MSVARWGVTRNPSRLGITVFKNRPNIIGFVWPAGHLRGLCSFSTFGQTVALSKRLVRYCTPEECAAFGLGWRAENDVFKLRYQAKLGEGFIIYK